MRLRTHMLALMLIASCPATWAADPTAAPVAPMMAQLRAPSESAPLEQQVAALQKQVSVVQAQLNALLSAVKVTKAGVVLQGPAVTIVGGTIDVKSDGNLVVQATNFTTDVGRMTNLHSGETTTISSTTAAIVQATGPVELKGTLVRFNGGSKAVATAGSVVHTVPATGNGQIVNGSTTVFAD